jgi:hypothetical protein
MPVRDIIPDSPFGKAKDIDRLKTQPVSGDQAAHHAARADVTIDRIKDNLRSMGINAASLDDQDTIDYYKALKKFPFSFSLDKPIDNYFDGNNQNIKGKAEVDQDSTAENFIIYFTVTEDVDSEDESYKKEEKKYKILFSPKTLQKNLLSTKINLPMLLKGKIYDVKITEAEASIGDIPTDSEENSDQEEINNDNSTNTNVGDDKTETNTDNKEGGKDSTQYVKLGKDDLKDLNEKINNLQKSANTIKQLKLTNYSDNKNFRDALLLNLIRSKITNIKINGEPISVTLKKLKENGLLEAPTRSREINKKDQLPVGWENQMSSFFSNVFTTFVKLNKCCKNTPTYTEIKKFFKLLFLIVKEGQANYSDEKKREQLYKKLVGTIVNFSSALAKTRIEFSNKSKNESTTSLFSIIQEMVFEAEEESDVYDRKLKILSVPNFAYERDDDDDEVSGSGKKTNVPKGESLATSNSKISNIKGTGASSWTSDNIETFLNNEFKSNRVLVKKSISKKDTLILYYPGIKQKLGTDAVLISTDNISNLFIGKKLKNYKVKIGPKAAGREEFKEEGEATITLLPS